MDTQVELQPVDEREGLASASGMDQTAHCPGCRAAQKGLPELPKTAVTDDGTAIHGAMETGDDSELKLDAKEIAANLKEVEAREVANWKAAIQNEEI